MEAVGGIVAPKNCKFTVTVESIVILDAIEIIECTPEAIKSIEAVDVWKIGTIQALNVLCDKELDYLTSISITKNIEKIQEELRHYEKENKKLCEEYLEKDSSGNYIEENGGFRLKEDTKDEYWRKKEELDNFEVEVDIYKISKESLFGIKMQPIMWKRLEIIIEQ